MFVVPKTGATTISRSVTDLARYGVSGGTNHEERFGSRGGIGVVVILRAACWVAGIDDPG